MTRLGGVLLVLLAASALAAPGSWRSSLPETRLGLAGRFYHSEPVKPPAAAEGKAIVRVGWHYRLPAGRRVRAWLCQRGQCLPLGTARRGRFLAPPDWQVAGPLRVRFQLPAGERRAVTVRALALTVEYR